MTLVLLVPSITVSIRRLHDSDKSGWWTLLLYAPWVATIVLAPTEPSSLTMFAAVLILGAIAWFALMVQPGTVGDNRFGADPRPATVADAKDAD